jgi:hypothetical protein
VIAAAFAIVALFVIGSVIIAGVQKRRQRKIYRLEISNLGNVHCRYGLRAEDPAHALKFQFILNGTRLPQRTVSQVTEVVTERKVPVAPPVPSSSPAGPAGKRVRGGAGQALRTGGVIAGVISSRAAILPRSVGAPLQQAVRPVRRVQSTASRAARLPTQMSRAMPASSAARSTAEPTRPQTVPAGQRSLTEPLAPHRVEETWAQTPFVAPGETLRLDLRIAPLNPYQTQHYSFKVVSRAIEQEDAPLVVEKGSVQIVRVSQFRRLLPYFIFAVVAMVIAGLAIVFLLMNLGVLGP